MNRNIIRIGAAVVLLVLGALGYVNLDELGFKDPAPSGIKKTEAVPTEARDLEPSGHRPIFVDGPKGKTDIAGTLERIDKGIKHEHKNDGSVFGNYEGRLPKKPRGYYREYVHPTPGIRHAGPQRVVLGKNGEVYYTADHYESFVKVEVSR